MASNINGGDEVLGQGIAFPLQLNRGQVGMKAYDNQVRQSILLILGTGVGERVMRPDFGGNLERLAFEPMSAVTLTYVQQQVRETLVRFEPRIEVLDVTVTPDTDAGQLEATIQYRVKRTDSVFNLVYPFYLERGER
jgi:phage baseplate assembly protein W